MKIADRIYAMDKPKNNKAVLFRVYFLGFSIVVVSKVCMK